MQIESMSLLVSFITLQILLQLSVQVEINSQLQAEVGDSHSYNVVKEYKPEGQEHAEKLLQRQHCNSTVSVAVCALMHNPRPADVEEWIWYHKWIGVQHFIVRELHSTNAMETLQPYIDQALVSYTHSSPPYLIPPKRLHYSYCLENFGLMYDFFALIDVNDYIMLYQPKEEPCLNIFLEEFQDYAGLAPNLKYFQKVENHNRRLSGGTLGNYQNYTQLYGGGSKAIVNSKYIVGDYDYYEFDLAPGMYLVDENYIHVPPKTLQKPSFDYISINHYSYASVDKFVSRLLNQFPQESLIRQSIQATETDVYQQSGRGIEMICQCCADELKPAFLNSDQVCEKSFFSKTKDDFDAVF